MNEDLVPPAIRDAVQEAEFFLALLKIIRGLT
jgi:hypothetical protein